MDQERWTDPNLVDPTASLTPALNLVNGAAPKSFLALHQAEKVQDQASFAV